MHRITVSMGRAGGLGAIALLALTVQAQTPDGDWPTYNRTYSGERFSPIKEINTTNVSKLRTICTYDTGESVAFQTGPLVLNGVMYFTTV
jgi:alcohol dehydrogenase (cytochrome c)